MADSRGMDVARFPGGSRGGSGGEVGWEDTLLKAELFLDSWKL